MPAKVPGETAVDRMREDAEHAREIREMAEVFWGTREPIWISSGVPPTGLAIIRREMIDDETIQVG